jgi:hypothetical protein
MCEYIVVSVGGVIVSLAADERRLDVNTCHCGHWPLQSVTVTPACVRDKRDVHLAGIWRNALDLLASADRWLVVGYSLPAEDIAIRALLLKACRIRKASARPPLRRWIVQKGGRSRHRYTSSAASVFHRKPDSKRANAASSSCLMRRFSSARRKLYSSECREICLSSP